MKEVGWKQKMLFSPGSQNNIAMPTRADSADNAAKTVHYHDAYAYRSVVSSLQISTRFVLTVSAGSEFLSSPADLPSLLN